MNQMPKFGNLAVNVMDLMKDLLRWQDHIEDAMRRTGNMYTFDDIVASILRQEKQFYNFDDCFIIMQLDVYPQCKVYHCFLAGGKMQAIKDAESVINDIAKDLGCKAMSISGRTGWPKALKNDGWEHRLSVLHKEVY